MSLKIVICVISLTLCTSYILQCVAGAVSERSPRNLDELTKIAKGHDVPIKDYPFMVSMQISFQHKCGGTLVHPLWVLTAAHCISGPAPTQINQVGHVDTILDASVFTVVAGLTYVNCVGYLYDPIPGNPNRRKVAEVHRHEEYVTITDKPKFWNDIALMKLESSFGDEIPVQLAPLAPPDFVEPTNCVVIGWGFQPDVATCKQSANQGKRDVGYPNIKTHPEYFIHLKAVDVLNVDRSYCTGKPWNQLFLEETQLCLDTRATGNPCNGDSGGPMVCDGKLVGLLSSINEHALEKCNDNDMAVYTRVAKYRDWIAKFVPAENVPAEDEAAKDETAKDVASVTCHPEHGFIYLISIVYVMLM